MSSHLVLVPSLACPAGCAYCFGPHVGAEVMSRETIDAVVRWQRMLACDGPDAGGDLEITFHGGEPLVPGVDFYRMALPALRDGLAPCWRHDCMGMNPLVMAALIGDGVAMTSETFSPEGTTLAVEDGAGLVQLLDLSSWNKTAS
jgi:hypothetical protein